MTMIDEMARSMCENSPSRRGFWDSTPESRKKGYRTLATAALDALMEPTEGMIEAGCAAIENHIDWDGNFNRSGGPSDGFRAMLTAAKEGK